MGSEQGEEMYNPEEDQENEEIAMPRRLLLSRMGLDEDNKINLKLSLELELPESAKEAKKAKKREAEEKEAEEPEPKKAKRTARHSKKGKNSKNSKKAEEQEIEELEGFEAIDKAENKESSMSVTENEKSEPKTKKKQEEEDEEEEEEEEFPVLRSHPEIYKLSTELPCVQKCVSDYLNLVIYEVFSMKFSPKKVLVNSWAETWSFWDIFGKKSRFSKFPSRPSGARCAPEDKFQKFRFLTENVPKRPTTGAGAARTTNIERTVRRHIDVILDWISTVVQWIQSG